MNSKRLNRPTVEVLEARIAPATLTTFPTIADAENQLPGTAIKTASVESAIVLRAGDLLITGAEARSGTYLMFVERGTALVFTTDFNNNGAVDFNEITGIAAGNGLRLTSFVDIHGDIVTNLDSDFTLTDSDNNPSNDDIALKGDGRVLTNATIESITLRSLTIEEITAVDPNGNPRTANLADLEARLAFSTYSIHGDILVGGNFGVVGDLTSGLTIDIAGTTIQEDYFDGNGSTYYHPFKPTFGAIRTGTAAGGEYFSFGVSRFNDVQGTLKAFQPRDGVSGGDIFNIRTVDGSTIGNTPQPVNFTSLIAGNGGAGARGGNIDTVSIIDDNTGGYEVIAGNGGRGAVGGAGGNILNFRDLGSVTSQIVIRTGSGGVGSTGAGGNAGNIELAALNVNGGVTVDLGDGGNGFTKGGNGASILRSSITTPEGTAEITRAIVGSTHMAPVDPVTGKLTESGRTIGTHRIVDFNEDGFGDFAFTTSESEQLVIQFGDGFGGTLLNSDGSPMRIYLDGEIFAEALTTGDFNGDGHMDVAVASMAQGAQGGIKVFLGKWEDADLNGLTNTEDLNDNGIDDFLGFYSSRQSALPSLNTGDAEGGPILSSRYGYYFSGNAISDMVAGDFDGDGYTDIAVSATYRDQRGPNQVVMFMTPDLEDGRPTGQFYANVGTRTELQQGANPLVPFIEIGESNFAMLEASPLNTSQSYDVLWAVPVDLGYTAEAIELNNFITVIDISNPSILGPTVVTSVIFPDVDTNRSPAATSLATFFVRDFTVLDFSGDGTADVVGLSETPQNFLVSMSGDGVGGFATTTGVGNQAGLFFGGPPRVGIDSGDLDGDGVFDEVAVWSFGPFLPVWQSTYFEFLPGALFFPTGAGGNASTLGRNPTLEIRAFDVMQANAAFPSSNLLTAIPVAGEPIELGGQGGLVFGSFTPLGEHFVYIEAGRGGDSQIGAGGNGGSLGGPSSISTFTDANGNITTQVIGSLDISLPINQRYAGQVSLIAGDGGNGFSVGGNGGFVSGTSIRFPTTDGTLFTARVEITSGDGGFGLSGRGGNGGNISENSIQSAYQGLVVDGVRELVGARLIAGDGGRGLTGGNGGSITGLPPSFTGFADIHSLLARAEAGNGGNGVKAGGAGGNITSLNTLLNVEIDSIRGGALVYIAGHGGNAVSGPGGSGGSVTESSPFQTNVSNFLAGDIYLRGGAGGDGRSGGAGGDVSAFNNRSSSADNPAVVTVIAGEGGDGTIGNGGAGGSVINVSAGSTGTPNQAFLPGTGLRIAPSATPYSYNRVLAGDGGASSGGTGGAGGDLTAVDVRNSNNPYAAVAGAGGNGLRQGGSGGSITNLTAGVGGSSVAKALIIAGAGGDAFAYIANPNESISDPDQGFKVFGGVVGRGGNGGSINGVFDATGANRARFDIIAGNGGDTVNYGRVEDLTNFTGRGGSVSNVILDGNIGNLSGSIPIKSYNNLATGQSVKEFVFETLRSEESEGLILDEYGNVGVVVGAAGRIKAQFAGYDIIPIYTSQPAPTKDSSGRSISFNGSLTNIRANNIMSAVAGNVERIAAIQSVTDVRILNSGQVGADKAPFDGPTNPDRDFRDKFGNLISEPRIEGSLIDGAVISATQPRKTVNGVLVADILPGPVFVIS